LTLPRWSSTAQYYGVTLRSQRYRRCSITELLSYLQVMLSTVQNGSNLSSESSTAVYRTVLHYSVAANSWSLVTNITTGYWQVLLPQRNSEKKTRKFLVMVLDFTAVKIQHDSTTAKYCLVLSLYLPVSVVLVAARVATITLDRNLQCAARSNWMENVPPIGGLLAVCLTARQMDCSSAYSFLPLLGGITNGSLNGSLVSLLVPSTPR
jgi:hypothetical protein